MTNGNAANLGKNRFKTITRMNAMDKNFTEVTRINEFSPFLAVTF